MDNFVNPKNGKTFFIREYKMKIVNLKAKYFDVNGNVLVDSETGDELEYKRDEQTNFSSVVTLKTNTKEGLQTALKKRSQEHYKKEIEEIKMHKLKQIGL